MTIRFYMLTIAQLIAAAVLACCASLPANAKTQAQNFKLFGHDAVIRSTHKTVGEEIIDRETLSIDKKVLVRNREVYIQATGSFGDTGFAIGRHTSGAMCDNNYFILIFPPGEAPRINGKFQACFARFGVEKDHIIFETPDDTPGYDPDLRSRWIWTAAGGLGPEQHFKIKTGVVGNLLRSRSLRQPAELLEHAEFTAQLEQFNDSSGVSANEFFATFEGTGTVHYDGDLMIGRVCQADSCSLGSLLVVVDIPSMKLYFALKSGDKPAIILPQQPAWPPGAQHELGQWRSQSTSR